MPQIIPLKPLSPPLEPPKPQAEVIEPEPIRIGRPRKKRPTQIKRIEPVPLPPVEPEVVKYDANPFIQPLSSTIGSVGGSVAPPPSTVGGSVIASDIFRDEVA